MLTYQEKKNLEKVNFNNKKILTEKSSRFSKSQGIDFRQLREYVYGDDIRLVDWKSTARSQKMIVKEFCENINCVITILVDFTKSTKIGADYEKSEIIKKTAYAIAYSAIIKKIPITIGIFYEDKIAIFKIKTEADILKSFENAELQDLSLQDFIKQTKNNILIIISDFLDQRLLDLNSQNQILGLRCRDLKDLNLLNYFGTFADPEINSNYYLDLSGQNFKKLNNQIIDWWKSLEESWGQKGWPIRDLTNHELINKLVSILNK